jgi:hypothetical protein
MRQQATYRGTYPQGRSPARGCRIVTVGASVAPAVLELMASDHFRPELVTTNVASFDDAPVALQEHCQGSALKTILMI